MSYPKSLAERLRWMAENLPGFADELAAARQASVDAEKLRQQRKTGARPQRSEDARQFFPAVKQSPLGTMAKTASPLPGSNGND